MLDAAPSLHLQCPLTDLEEEDEQERAVLPSPPCPSSSFVCAKHDKDKIRQYTSSLFFSLQDQVASRLDRPCK